MAIYDCFTYNGEHDILDIRLNILYPYVDKFIIIEFDETFSGKKKPKYLLKDWNKDWVKFLDKIDYAYITKSEYSKYEDLAKTSPNVPKNGPKHWKREFCQKESIKDAIQGLKDEDIMFIGDVDEVWDSEMKLYDRTKAEDYPGKFPLNGVKVPAKLKLRVYSYWLNNRSNEEFWGTIVAPYSFIKDKCLNHLRSTDLPKTQLEFGWHFTSMGGYENVRRKLTDSYTEDSYASPQVLNNLEQNINGNRDFLWRQFNYTNDESEWPIYLSNNRQTYKHLLKP